MLFYGLELDDSELDDTLVFEDDDTLVFELELWELELGEDVDIAAVELSLDVLSPTVELDEVTPWELVLSATVEDETLVSDEDDTDVFDDGEDGEDTDVLDVVSPSVEDDTDVSDDVLSFTVELEELEPVESDVVDSEVLDWLLELTEVVVGIA